MPKGLWWIVDIASFCCWIAVLALIFGRYDGLPERIPTHFGLTGAPDGWGSRGSVFLLAVVASILQIMLTAAPFFPNSINVLGERTPAKINAAIAMLRIVKLETMTMMVFLVDGMTRAFHVGMVPLVFLVLILGTVGAGLFYSSRNP